jgi:hypothetical protein
MIKKDSPHATWGTAGAPRTSTKRTRSAARVAASPRLPMPFLATAPPLPEAVAVSVPDLGEVDGRGAVFVLPVVSEADSPQAREGGIVRRRLVALTGLAQWRLRARVEAARMRRPAWLRPAPAAPPGGG